MHRRLVIVAGFARSGTSIMVDCLRESGFNTALPILTEHPRWIKICYLIARDMGARYFLEKYRNHISGTHGKGAVLDMIPHDSIIAFDRNKEIARKTRHKIDGFAWRIKEHNIEVLKNPHSAPALTYLKNEEPYRSAKYIFMKRDPKQAAKSYMKLKWGKSKYNYLYDYVFTEDRAVKIYNYHQGIYSEVMEDVNHIDVNHEDFINLRNIDKISEFIGTKFNTNLIDLDMVSRHV